LVKDPEVKKEVFSLLRDEDLDVRGKAVKYFTTLGKDDPEVKKEVFKLLRDETYLPSSNRIIQDIAVEFLSQFAREESLEKAPILFASEDLPTKRGAYKLMKALIQA
jgi:HEAT repeat protein